MRCEKWIIIPFEFQTVTESYEGYLLKINYGVKNLWKVIFSL